MDSLLFFAGLGIIVVCMAFFLFNLYDTLTFAQKEPCRGHKWKRTDDGLVCEECNKSFDDVVGL